MTAERLQKLLEVEEDRSSQIQGELAAAIAPRN